MEQASLSFADSLFNGSQVLDGSSDTGNAANQAAGLAQGTGVGATSFGQTLQTALQNVNTLQTDASDAATAFALGQSSDIHTVMIAGQKATLALDLATEVRNKVVDAYQSIMQTSM